MTLFCELSVECPASRAASEAGTGLWNNAGSPLRAEPQDASTRARGRERDARDRRSFRRHRGPAAASPPVAALSGTAAPPSHPPLTRWKLRSAASNEAARHGHLCASPAASPQRVRSTAMWDRARSGDRSDTQQMRDSM